MTRTELEELSVALWKKDERENDPRSGEQIIKDFSYALLVEIQKKLEVIGHTVMSGHGRMYSQAPVYQPEKWKQMTTLPIIEE